MQLGLPQTFCRMPRAAVRVGLCLLCSLFVGSALCAGESPTTFPVRSTEKRAGLDWWSLQRLRRSSPPHVSKPDWIVNPIDAFVLEKLDAASLAPSPPASRRELLRRVTLDLIGLPPTPGEMADFYADASPDAYERVVDRLLASPHYGERWGRHWLDVVRFGESQGFERNRPRPNAWRYRDWVIAAFNDDIPYDQFVRAQIAGDVLSPGDPLSVTATGYLVIGSYDSLGMTMGTESMRQQARLDHLEDLVGNLSQTFLGMTVNCGRCHDHKFDPISQREYYQLAAALAGTEDGERPTGASSGPDATRRRDSIRVGIRTAHRQMQPLDGSIRERIGQQLLADARKGADDARTALEAGQRALREAEGIAVALAEESGTTPTPAGRKHYLEARAAADNHGRAIEKLRKSAAEADSTLQSLQNAGPASTVSYPRILAEMPAADRMAYQSPLLSASDLELRDRLLAGGPAQAVISRASPVMHVLLRGDLHRPADAVAARGLEAVQALPADLGLRPESPEGERRAKLAQWITDPRNPLPARVIVNRLWHYHFGHGLVATPNDFGFNGARPSHPELIDWLATELIDGGWRLKRIQRDIVLSQTYRQSSVSRADAAAHDADNRLLWRHAPARLDAETIRDSLLAVAGELNPQMGGPSFADYQHRFADSNDFYEPKDVSGPEVDRRSIYRTWNRSGSDPFLETMDCPDPSVATPARVASTTPLQALAMLNNSLTVRMADALAARVAREAPASPAEGIRLAYQLSLSRDPSADESARAVAFVAARGMSQFYLVLFNSSEFLYVD